MFEKTENKRKIGHRRPFLSKVFRRKQCLISFGYFGRRDYSFGSDLLPPNVLLLLATSSSPGITIIVIMTLGIMTLVIMTLVTMALVIMTLVIMTLVLMTLIIMALVTMASITMALVTMALVSYNEASCNNSNYNETSITSLYNGLQIVLNLYIT